jgi:CheY-like chemotaxis protein
MILYVENEPFFDDLQMLKEEGLDYDLAETAAEARDRLQETPYDAVLLDIMLEPGEYALAPQDVPPYMGGVTVLRLIREGKYKKDESGKDLPVVVYTAVGLMEVREVTLNLLGTHAKDRYFEKAVASFEEVLKALSRAIRQRRTGS